MTRLQLRFDMRAPPFGAPREQLFRAAIDMAEYVDANGFYGAILAEHHGVPDGYLPSPIVLGAAMAARTKRVRLQLLSVIAPLHDPLRLAEDLAVLDVISGGRLSLAIGAGYVPSEYAMFGKDMKKRPSLVENAVATLKAAWRGEPFEYQGRTVRVTPTPLQRPHPTLLLGGNVPASAERAGRIADGFSTLDPELHRIYRESALRHGRTPEAFQSAGPSCVFVSEDPAATWARILPHVLYEINDYGAWAVAAGLQTGYSPASTLDEILATGGYAVWTPEECIAMAGRYDQILFHPLVGGLDPAVGWASLRLVVERVLPALQGERSSERR